MAAPDGPGKMRLFTTFGKAPGGGVQDPASGAQGADGSDASRRLEQLAAGSSRWSPFFAFSSKHDLPTTSLLLQCIGLGHASIQALRTFDGQAAAAGDGGGGGAAKRDGLDGQLAAAFAEQLVPGWWHLTHTMPAWSWHLQNLLESPCFGVPGLCRFAAARAAWLARHVQLAIDGDACRQVVVLRAGWSPLAHSLAQPGVVFYEVDSKAAVQRKKEALDALLPGWRRSPARPRFAEVDFSGGLKALITELTGAGFDPSLRCCVVAEGLLAYLTRDQADSLLRDLAALCPPGSRIFFDFLHAPALAGAADALPGFAAFAAAAANKGAPLRGGMPPSFSAMVKLFQPHQFRVAQVLQPHDVAAFWQRQQDGPLPPPAAAAATAPKDARWPAPPARLPFVPEFFGLAEVVKIDARLLLRRAASSGGSVGGGAAAASVGVGGWVAAGAAAALASPSCLVRSLAFLLWGGTSLQAPPVSTPALMLPSGGATALTPPPPAAAAASAALLHSQQSAEWSLSAVSSSQPDAAPAGLPASRTAAAVAGPAPAAPPSQDTSALQASGATAGDAGLQHALSIGPMGAQSPPSAASVPAASSSAASAGSVGGDSGHLLPRRGGSGAPAVELGAVGSGTSRAGPDDETAWSDSSLFSFSLFF